MEWQTDQLANGRPHDNIRCFNVRLGGQLWNIPDGGPWTVEEAQAHINLLELRAAFLALQMYTSKLNNQHILHLINNRTAIAYLNHKGGTTSRALSNQAMEIWEWCLRRNLTIHAEHIPWKPNNRADSESRRNLDSSD